MVTDVLILTNKKIEAPKGCIPHLKTFRKMMRKPGIPRTCHRADTWVQAQEFPLPPLYEPASPIPFGKPGVTQIVSCLKRESPDACSSLYKGVYSFIHLFVRSPIIC